MRSSTTALSPARRDIPLAYRYGVLTLPPWPRRSSSTPRASASTGSRRPCRPPPSRRCWRRGARRHRRRENQPQRATTREPAPVEEVATAGSARRRHPRDKASPRWPHRAATRGPQAPPPSRRRLRRDKPSALSARRRRRQGRNRTAPVMQNLPAISL